jgi:uncharacterized protein YcnI
MTKRRPVAIATALAALALPATAQGHVFLEEAEAPAEGFPILEFVVPHGCDGSPTTGLTVQFPESVPSVTPEAVPGWEVSTKEGPKDEVELFGETVTEGVSEVTWTSQGEPLADGQLLRFGAEVALPATEGQTLHFPTIQKCEQGQTRWIQIPAEGETEEDLDEPAPALTLTAAESGHGGEAQSDAEHGEAAATEAGPTDDEREDDSESNGLAIAGIVIGGLGLLTGGTALARSRRNG